jgi:hypothetical protein
VEDRSASRADGLLGLHSRAQEAERALEQACLARFGTRRPTGVSADLQVDSVPG